jgi:hypothetical protein
VRYCIHSAKVTPRKYLTKTGFDSFDNFTKISDVSQAVMVWSVVVNPGEYFGGFKLGKHKPEFTQSGINILFWFNDPPRR